VKSNDRREQNIVPVRVLENRAPSESQGNDCYRGPIECIPLILVCTYRGVHIGARALQEIELIWLAISLAYTNVFI
jgi:hypothetical protein